MAKIKKFWQSLQSYAIGGIRGGLFLLPVERILFLATGWLMYGYVCSNLLQTPIQNIIF